MLFFTLETAGPEVLLIVAALSFSALLLSRPRRPQQEDLMAEGPRQHFVDTTCAICLDSCRYRTETNCGHTFCAQCIKQCVTQRNFDDGVPCPLCRRCVTILFPMYTAEENDSQEGHRQLDFIRRYNTLYAPIADRTSSMLRDWPMLMNRLRRDILTADRLTMLIKVKMCVLAVFALVYVLVPVDIISEAMFGVLGLIDDLIIIFIITLQISMIYRSFLLRQIRE